MQREPPPEFQRISLWQVLNADRELFNRLAEECRDGLEPRADGRLPMDIEVAALMIDPTLLQFLSHLPGKAAQSKSRNKPQHRDQTEAEQSDGERQRHQGRGRGRGGKGNRAKGKGGSRQGPYVAVQMPPGLEKCWSRLGRDPLCMKYNQGNCPDQGIPDGDKCSRGLHKCCTPYCGGAHPHFKCTAKNS